MSQWKKIVKGNESEKPKTPQKVEQKEDEFPKEHLIDGCSQRNNTRKLLYKNLKNCLKDDETEENKKELIEKIIQIEEKIYEKFKGDGPYSNRVLEIIHNIKDKDNTEFREGIVNGKLSPEDLSTMDVIKMVNQEKRKEINQTIENRVNEARSDWNEKHAKVTEGVYKCKKCGGKKTTQSEMQTRSADEPMTIFIHCVDCGNSWKASRTGFGINEID